MKGTQLGEFEELVLLTVGVFNGEAYGVVLKQKISETAGRNISVSTVHTALYRLEQKGFVKSYYGGETEKRGGRRKRLYEITASGYKALEEARTHREMLWKLLPEFNFQS